MLLFCFVYMGFYMCVTNRVTRRLQHPYTLLLSSPVAPSLSSVKYTRMFVQKFHCKAKFVRIHNTFSYTTNFSLNSTVWQFGRFSHKQGCTLFGKYLFLLHIQHTFMRYGAGRVSAYKCVENFDLITLEKEIC